MKDDEYFPFDSGKSENPVTLDRREFLKLLGGGIIISFSVGDLFALQERRRGSGYPEDFNAYLRIGEDGRVSCFTGKIEMGQGIITSLAQMMAEELDVPLKTVDMVMGDTALCPWDAGTFGSRSTKYFGPPLRQAAAEARSVLLQLASEHLRARPENLATKDGAVFEKKNPEKKVSYAQLAKGNKIERHLEKKPPIKHYSKHTISGQPTDRLDSRQKVTGEAKFTGDIRLPGMLYARILRPPAHGAKLKSVDTSAAEKIKDIQIIRDNDMIAVLHKHYDVADKTLGLIKAQFEPSASQLDNTTIFNHLKKSASEGNVVTEAGNLDAGKGLASKTFDKAYFNHYVAHAPAENHTAVVKIEGDRATVWASTQAPFRAQGEVSRSSEPFYNIPHHRVLSYGGWGGRGGGSVHPFGVGAWRGPGSNTNVFAIESHIDVMAEAVGMDPLEFRLHNLTDERMKRVLRAAAEKFGRSFSKAPSGKGYGIACTDYLGTYLATMAEVNVDKRTGEIRVVRVVCAQDTGEVINPEGVRMQIEGCINMGLGYCLREEIRFRDGRILDENFDTYEIPRFSWLPKIETVLVDNPEMPPQGCGEPAITSMGGVIANAVYDAIGARLFVLPMTPARIKEALSKGRDASSATNRSIPLSVLP